MAVKICKTKKDLNVMITRRLGPILNGLDPLGLHSDTVRHNHPTYETNALHIKLAFR
jgi:hypothetical protein